MRILFVIPRKNSSAILPSPDIGIAYVARAALNAGAQVQVLDAHKERMDLDDFKAFIVRNGFDLIGIKCLSVDVYTALEYCRIIKEVDRGALTLLGGYHPTSMPQDFMRHEQVDYLIRGEAEDGMSALVKLLSAGSRRPDASALSTVPALVYRDDAKNVRMNQLTFRAEVDTFGFPAWELFKIDEYPRLPGPGGKFLPVLSSRGCPALCSFCCSHSMHGMRVRLRSAESVIDEISWLATHFSIDRISMFDDNFTFYRQHAIKICRLFREKRFSLKFDIPQGVRLDKIDEEVLQSLEEAGCDYMGVGIESGSQRTLDLIQKGISIELIKDKISLIKRTTTSKLMGFFIIGFPHEDVGDIRRTIDFALRLRLDYATFTLFTPFPGTELFDQMLREGYFSLDTFKWDDLLLDRAVFNHRNMSRETLKGLQREAYLRFYLRLSKISFFWRIIFQEKSLFSYLKRFASIVQG